MTPPKSTVRVVMIRVLVGVGMMMTMKADPFNRTTLAGKAGTEDQNVFEPLGSFEAAVAD
jgi:hypothetical protein